MFTQEEKERIVFILENWPYTERVTNDDIKWFKDKLEIKSTTKGSVKKNENDNEFVLSSFYSESDFDRSILNIKHTAYFDKENLKVNLFDLVNHDNYGCMKLEKILSEAMKKEILKNFLLQKNADRQ